LIEHYKIDPVTPPVTDGSYLIEYLFEMGPTNGDHALTAGDLVHYQTLTGIEWTPHQARTLLKLSRAYIGEMHAATKHDAPPPWQKFERPWRWIQMQQAERRLDAFL